VLAMRLLMAMMGLAMLAMRLVLAMRLLMAMMGLAMVINVS